MNAPQKPSILIVDDEPEILQSLFGLLRREFELFIAETGEHALEIMSQQAIQVVMTDQRMPGMTGVELMAQIQKRYPNAVRIIFTGYADIKVVIEAINSGGLFRYLTKPWDPDELVEVLKLASSHYEKTNERRQLLAEVRELILSVSEKNSTDGHPLLTRIDQVFGDT